MKTYYLAVFLMVGVGIVPQSIECAEPHNLITTPEAAFNKLLGILITRVSHESWSFQKVTHPIANPGYVNSLLDVIAPDAQTAQLISELFLNMPVQLAQHSGYFVQNIRTSSPTTQRIEVVARDAGILMSELFAYVFTRLVMGEADAGYIAVLCDHIQTYIVNAFGARREDRLNFENEMRTTFNYFINRLRERGRAEGQLTIFQERLDRLSQIALLLVPERPHATASNASPVNLRLSLEAVNLNIARGVVGRLSASVDSLGL